MNDTDYDEFVREATVELEQLNEAFLCQYNIGAYEEWFYDQDAGLLSFKNAGVSKVIARFKAIGSLSNLSNTWLWSWDNKSINKELSEDMLKVKAFGEQEKIDELMNAKWPAKEEDAWAMAAVAVKILRLAGAYRCPNDNGYLFVALYDIQWQQ